MNWYYAEGAQQAGPVSEEDLLRLVASGKIRSDTLVWHEGLANWQPYGQLRPGPGAQTGVPPVQLPENEVVCVECGRIVSKENALAYGGGWVCANCKPAFFQKVKEGAALPAVPTALPYAGFWIRLGAKVIDWLATGLVIGIPVAVLMFLFVQQRPSRGAFTFPFDRPLGIGLYILINVGSTVLIVAYNWFFLAKFAATLGKLACGLKVVSATGAPLTSGQALGRSAAELLSQMICYIGYIIAAFDQEKRALHDHMANTRVVHK